MASDVENWRNTFTQRSSGVLTTAKRMTLPTEKERLIWPGGDATKEVVAGIDWFGRVFLTDGVNVYYRLLKERVPDASDEIIIAVAELL